MKNFAELTRENKEFIEEYGYMNADKPVYKEFMKNAEDMVELVMFDLMSNKNDIFFSTLLLNVDRRIGLVYPCVLTHQMQSNRVGLIFNPMLMIKYSLKELVMYVKHEVYHIAFLHALKAKNAQTDNRLIKVLAADLSVNSHIDTLEHWWTIQRMRREFNMNLTVGADYEYYVSELELARASNTLFNEFVSGYKETDLELLMGDLTEDLFSDGLLDENNEEIIEDVLTDFITEILRSTAQTSRGNIPAGLSSYIEKLLAPPAVSWQQEFAKMIGSVPVPYKKTPMRLNRRCPERTDLKGKLNDREVDVVVALDTSGSMGAKELQYCISEISNIIKNRKSKITVVECDAVIGRVYDVKRPSDIDTNITGGGGTSFSPVINWVNENNKRNSVVVYLTDGYGESVIPKPKCHKMLWIILPNGRLSLEESYGTVKLLEEDKKYKKL